MKAVRVRKEHAEEVRKFVEKIGAKDKKRLILQYGDYVEIPILEVFEALLLERGYEIVEQKEVRLKEKLEDFLGFKINYKILGDIAIVKIPEDLAGKAKEIGEAILRFYPRCRAVWREIGKESAMRVPKMELLAGSGSETIHKENDCTFKLDVTKVMFSLGNQFERLRVAKLTNEDEIVVDMFAGIGYFTIPVAKNVSKVYAIEINGDAYKYLLENIKLNKLRNVIPILGDCMFVAPESVADRVIMGHIYCHDYLETAIRALDGKGFLHYHEATPEKILFRPAIRVEKAAKKMGKRCKILQIRKVKNYAPCVFHVVVDALIH